MTGTLGAQGLREWYLIRDSIGWDSKSGHSTAERSAERVLDVGNTEGLRYVIEASRRAVGRDPGVAHLAVELDRLLDLLSVQSRAKIRGTRVTS